MGSLWDRLIIDDGEPRLRSGSQMAVADIVSRLEAGTHGASLGLSGLDLIAILGFAALEGPDSLGPSLVHTSPPRPALKSVLSEPALAELFPKVSSPARLALAAGLLQIHDFWDASHEAAQVADDLGERQFSAYWHGIAHRREPDAGNATYWFRRVGRHPLFESLVKEARRLIEERGAESAASRVLGPGGWNSSAMIDLCTGARPGTSVEELARWLQRLEMQLLLDATTSSIITTTTGA